MAIITNVNLSDTEARELAALGSGLSSPEWQRLARSGAWDPMTQPMSRIAMVAASGIRVDVSHQATGYASVAIPGTGDEVRLGYRVGGQLKYRPDAVNRSFLWAAALVGLLKRDGSYAAVVEYSGS